MIQKLQLMQNVPVRVIIQYSHFESHYAILILQVYQPDGVPTIKKTAIQGITLMCKALNNLGPKLGETHLPTSAGLGFALFRKVPSHSEACCAVTQNTAFPVVAPCLRSSFPLEICFSPTVNGIPGSELDAFFLPWLSG